MEVSEEVEIVDYAIKKEYSCFVCGVKSDEKGLPLLVSETTHSRICLGQKLQEILSDKFIVLVKPKDSVCWDCAEVINWIDKYEIKIDVAKDHVVNKIIETYKKVEINVRKEETVESEDDYMDVPSPEETNEVYYKDPTYIPKAMQSPSTVTPVVKTRKFPCKMCNKLNLTAAAAGAHAAKVHRNQYSCEICNEKFSTEKKLYNHSVLHQTYKNDEQPKICTNKYTCEVCKRLFKTAKSYKIHMMNHQKTPLVENEKLFICITCGFETKNTEVYCRHVCNSSVMSLTCTTCKKRYVDSTSKDKKLKYQCQSCIKITDRLELIDETPESIENIKEQVNNVEINQNQQVISEMIENVENDLPENIMVTDDSIIISEEIEIEAQEEEGVSRMSCKTCDIKFKTIGLMRQHWDLTGHTREVSTTNLELNKIREKKKKTEQTFKVVKQNFQIRANVPGQNDEEIKKSDDVQVDCIVKFQNAMSVEDFIGMRGGKKCEACGILFGSEDILKKHQQNNCLTCVTCNVTFFDKILLKKHYKYTGHANWPKKLDEIQH